MKNKSIRTRMMSSSQIIIVGFLLVILIGSLLLMLPFATNDNGGASFIDALFTATSATCVTGLVVQDTATYWSTFGQFIILCLIQIGGLGVVTVALAVTMFAGRKIGLMQRSTMQEAIGAPKISGIVRMLGFILKTVFIIELLGAIVLSTVFIKEFGVLKGIWYSIFHSISAFCNAGFDLMGVKAEFSSLTSYSSNLVINITIMLLIVIGGIGFFTWEDIKTNKFHIKKYRMQSKVILIVTAFLIIVPGIYFYFAEYANVDGRERILNSMFQTVTARTAGFNTADLTMISEVGIMVMIILMLIGGAPGSTAGGMKTTTIAVLFATTISAFRRKDDINLFRRRIDSESIRSAATIFVMYITLFLSGAMIISAVEKVPLLNALFETSSAVATVGVTLGMTPGLSLVSRLILIVLMFMGRVGGLTIIFAALSGSRSNLSRYPKEKITVG